MFSINSTSVLAHLVRSFGVEVSKNEFATQEPGVASNQWFYVPTNHVGESTIELRDNSRIETLILTLDIPLYEDDLGLRIRGH